MSITSSKEVKEVLEAFEVYDHLEIVGYQHVWSNGTKIRRYQGQDNTSVTHNPSNGYRRMVAVLVEIDDE